MHSLRPCIKTLDPSFRWGDDNADRRESGKSAGAASPEIRLTVIPANPQKETSAGIQ
jgi:hypothetical protein